MKVKTHTSPGLNRGYIFKQPKLGECEPRVSTSSLPCIGSSRPKLASRVNFGTSFSGNWCGPYTLLPRVTIIGMLKEFMYALHIISAPAFAAEYGLVGSKLLCSPRPAMCTDGIGKH